MPEGIETLGRERNRHKVRQVAAEGHSVTPRRTGYAPCDLAGACRIALDRGWNFSFLTLACVHLAPVAQLDRASDFETLTGPSPIKQSRRVFPRDLAP